MRGSISGGHERSRHQEEDGRDEQQRDDELDLWRGPGCLFGVAAGGPGARLGGLGGERRAERSAVTRGSAERGDERRDTVGGRAAVERGERVGQRDAERGGVGDAVEFRGEDAVVAASDLTERAAGCEAGGHGDAQEIEDVAELRVDRLVRRRARRRIRRSGARKAPAAVERGEDSGERQRREKRDERRADLGGHHVAGRGVDPGRLEPRRQVARRPGGEPVACAPEQPARPAGAPGAAASSRA